MEYSDIYHCKRNRTGIDQQIYKEVVADYVSSGN